MAKQVTAFLGYAIYATYDGEAPDTADLILLDSEEEANKVKDVLNENPRKWGNLAYVEGFECCKTFCVRQTLRQNEQDFLPSADAALKTVEDEYDCEEEDSEDDGE